MSSLKSNQIHIDQLDSSLSKGQEIVDDTSIEDQKFKLVMVGRKVSEEEYENSKML